jgi:hypothetical protein
MAQGSYRSRKKIWWMARSLLAEKEAGPARQAIHGSGILFHLNRARGILINRKAKRYPKPFPPGTNQDQVKSFLIWMEQRLEQIHRTRRQKRGRMRAARIVALNSQGKQGAVRNSTRTAHDSWAATRYRYSHRRQTYISQRFVDCCRSQTSRCRLRCRSVGHAD